jgi:hypothetical protein
MSDENNNGGEHWSQGFEHDSVTTDNQEAFRSANAKYATQADAIVGGYNASKAVGKPFEFPETMEGFKDDQARDQFTSNANKLLGRTMPKDLESFAEVDFKAGLGEEGQVNEAFTGLVKQWAIDNKIPLETVSKLTEFYNGPVSALAMETMADRDTVAFEAKATACNEALIADLGSIAEVEKQTELFKRAITGMATENGLDLEATNEVVQAMVDGGLTTNPKLAKLMLQAFSPMAAEGGTHSGDGSSGGGESQITPYEWKKAEFPSTEHEWGNPSDSWENESQQLRNMAGIKQ